LRFIAVRAGDVLAQRIEGGQWKPGRSVSLLLWGSTAGGVPMVYWFG
jgi:hypothetical protein